MALPTPMILCILVVAVMTIPGTTASYYSICPSSQLDISTPNFRTNLLSILDAVPAAAAPTGFASLRSSGGLDPTPPAFARGLCFADRPSPQQCLGCLQSTVAEMKAKNCTYSWDAGIWGDDCFLAYSVTNTSSVFEDKFRRLNFTVGDEYPGLFEREELGDLAQSLSLLSGDALTSSGAIANTTTRGTSEVRALAHCARDRQGRENDCAQCLRDSARYLTQCRAGEDLECEYLDDDDGTHAGVAAVLGYNCYLRLEISPPTSHAGKGQSLRYLFLYQLIGIVVYATMM